MNAYLRLFLYIIIGYGMLVLAVFLLQRKMLYFPDREKPSAEFVRSAGLRFWPDEGNSFKGYLATEISNESRGTVLVFHGNAGSAWHRDYFAHALVPLGYRVVLAEYPGYGGRSGELSEPSFVDDAKAIIKRIHKDYGGPIYLVGESMGCGVACGVAANPPVPLAGIILITPWDSLPDLAQSLYWYLPARWLTRDRFDCVQNMQSFNKPVAVAVAMNDEIIPNKHSMRLYASITTPKRLWQFDGAGHNSWPTGPLEKWWSEAMDFVSAKQ